MFPCECVGVCSHTCRLQELIMVSSPCGSGLARYRGRKHSTQRGGRGAGSWQHLAGNSRTGWATKVRGMEAPRGCAPLGDGGPGPWAEPGRWVPLTGTKESPQSCSVMNLVLDRQWAPRQWGPAGAGPCHWDTAGGLDRAPRMGDDLNEDWKPEGWGFPAGGSHTSASGGPGLLRGPGRTHPTSGNR